MSIRTDILIDFDSATTILTYKTNKIDTYTTTYTYTA